uniref:delta-type opioid receptor isoform X1 n=1 Tax=Ciona intestinalis TaxID=7719 RepID=UPI000EF50840|nr:delta-type opioid receptor isoform X1 [Ciona intestinalis]|eukprot:XP_026690680.1 delta-type opioid receptor isoform X1 [Ciona intestinalis]
MNITNQQIHHRHDESILSKDNQTVNNSNMALTDESLQTIRLGIAVVYILICVFGLFGNAMLLGIMKSVKSLSVTDHYILNLAISDVMLLTTLPLATADMITGNLWPLGWFACKYMVCVVYFNISAGVWTVTTMTIDRFQCIVQANKMRGKRTKERAKKILAVVWCISLVYTLPVVYFADKSEGVCTLHYVGMGSLSVTTVLTMHMTFRFTVAFVVPLVILIICNTGVVCFLKSKDRLFSGKRSNTKRLETTEQVTRIVTMVTIAFLICWLPNFVTTLIFVFSPAVLGVIGPLNHRYYLLFHWMTVCLLYFNSCLNPFMYALLGGNYRNKVKSLFKTSWRRISHVVSFTSSDKRKIPLIKSKEKMLGTGTFQDEQTDLENENRVVEVKPSPNNATKLVHVTSL